MKIVSKSFLAAIILTLSFLILPSCAKQETTERELNFTLESIDGSTVNFSDYKGKVVVINFWATWCPPCRHELPDFASFHAKHREKGVEVIGIAINSPLSEIKKMAEEYNLKYPLCLSNPETEALFGGIRAVPTTFIIDRNGVQTFRRTGVMTEDQLTEAVKPLL